MRLEDFESATVAGVQPNGRFTSCEDCGKPAIEVLLTGNNLGQRGWLCLAEGHVNVPPSAVVSMSEQ